MSTVTVRTPALQSGDCIDFTMKRGYRVHEERPEDFTGSLTDWWDAHTITGLAEVASVEELRHQSYGNTGRATKSYRVLLTDGRAFHSSHQSTYPITNRSN